MLRNGGGASEEEESILGKFDWNKNEAVVHWDEKVGNAKPVAAEHNTDLTMFAVDAY
jgi:hypothetical protein